MVWRGGKLAQILSVSGAGVAAPGVLGRREAIFADPFALLLYEVHKKRTFEVKERLSLYLLNCSKSTLGCARQDCELEYRLHFEK